MECDEGKKNDRSRERDPLPVEFECQSISPFSSDPFILGDLVIGGRMSVGNGKEK